MDSANKPQDGQSWFIRLHDQVCEFLSCRALDGAWRKTVADSMLLGPLLRLKPLSYGSIGNILQNLSFAVAAILLMVLAAPSFTNDKNGLAIIALVGLALWLAGYVMGGRERRSTNAVDIFVLLYFAINIIAACSSHYFDPSIKGLSKVAVYIAGYFWFTCLVASSRRRQLWLVIALLLGGLVVSFYGLYQYKIGVAPLATWEDPSVEVKGTRIYSTLGNPNFLAGYLLPMVPLSAALGIAALWSKKWLLAVPAFATTGIIATATVLTGSRGGYIGLFLSAAVLVVIVVEKILSERPKLQMPVFMGLAVAAVVLLAGLHFVPTFEQRVSSIFAGREHSSNSYRMNVYESSFKMFKDSWWIGVGPGNQAFRLAYGLYMTSGFDALGTYCVPLEVAVEAGIFALLCFLALILCLLGRCHLVFWSKTDQGWYVWLAAGVAAALIGMMIHGLVDTVFYRPQVHFIFWLLVAIAQSKPESYRETPTP